MRSGDFENAIIHYERALTLPSVREDDSSLELNREQRQYARLRLAIADSLTDHIEESLRLMNDLSSEPPASLLMERLLTAVKQTDNPADLCPAVHNALEMLRDEDNILNRWSNFTNMYIGERYDDIVLSFENYPPDPSTAGCDPNYLQNSTLPSDAILEATEEAPLTEEIVSYPPVIIEQSNFHCGRTGELFCGLYEVDHQRALEMINTLTDEDFARESDSGWGGEFQFAVRYRRALALETLGRRDEALAAYVAIYEDAPESAWGMLAALHFETAN
jgi:tetratricopeptide (TPR) repeat protein